ncbi:MAG: bifunctional riboflavin kinase/FAD synthetase [Gammaproteobacteria bacterium]
MEFLRGLHSLRPDHRGCVLTIGNFDGVHRGHQAIIAQLGNVGQELGLPAVLLTFEPHPQELFAPRSAPARLTRLREKLEALRGTALRRVVCLRFNRRLADTSADDFIAQVLVERLGVRALVVGDDFRFGKGGAGDVAQLRRAGERSGFAVMRRDDYRIDGRRISSSWVREALASGRLDVATTLLGRSYAIHGRVAHGDRLGRTIGFPTANLPLKRRVPALAGVFAVQVHGAAETPQMGVANVGTRPTVNGVQSRLEVHLFDFAADIYGWPIEVVFLHKIRAEQRFESLAALQRQIHHDVAQARAFFATPAAISI